MYGVGSFQLHLKVLSWKITVGLSSICQRIRIRILWVSVSSSVNICCLLYPFQSNSSLLFPKGNAYVPLPIFCLQCPQLSSLVPHCLLGLSWQDWEMKHWVKTELILPAEKESAIYIYRVRLENHQEAPSVPFLSILRLRFWGTGKREGTPSIGTLWE